MNEKDPYQILGVARSATQADIKRAYRRLAKKHHPDRNAGDKSSERRFKEVQAAYEVLGEERRREQFDRFGAGGPVPEYRQWRSGGAPQGDNVQVDFGAFGDLTGIFEQFFNRGPARGARRRRAPRAANPRGANIEHAVELSLEEAARGTAREIRLAADGTQSERIEIRVPAGVSDGQKIRVRAKGQDGPGGRGDLMIVCRICPHAYFRRDDLDISLDLPLTFAEAVRGAKVDIPTLDGTTRLTVPPGTSGGAKLRLRGKGISDARSGRTGDMYAVVRIEAPRELSPKAGELLEQLERELDQQPRLERGWPT